MKDLIGNILLEFERESEHTLSREMNRFILPETIEVVLTFAPDMDWNFINKISECPGIEVNSGSNFIKIGDAPFNKSVRQIIEDRINYLYNDFIKYNSDYKKDYWIYLNKLVVPSKEDLHKFIKPLNSDSCISHYYNDIKTLIYKGKLRFAYNLPAAKTDKYGNEHEDTDTSVGKYVVALVRDNKVQSVMLRNEDNVTLKSMLSRKISKQDMKQQKPEVVDLDRLHLTINTDKNVPPPPHSNHYTLPVSTIEPVDINHRKDQISQKFNHIEDPAIKLIAMEDELGKLKQLYDEDQSELIVLRDSLRNQKQQGETNTEKYKKELEKFQFELQKHKDDEQTYLEILNQYKQEAEELKKSKQSSSGAQNIYKMVRDKMTSVKQLDGEIAKLENMISNGRKTIQDMIKTERFKNDTAWQQDMDRKIKIKEEILRQIKKKRNYDAAFINRQMTLLDKQENN